MQEDQGRFGGAAIHDMDGGAVRVDDMPRHKGTSLTGSGRSWRRRLSVFSRGPGMSLKRRLERRLGDAACVIRDRRGGDRSDHFQELIFAESGHEESVDVLVAEMSALFDHR